MKYHTKILLPGATLGVLGGGQLGRMFCLAAKRMGYRVITLDPEINSPCGQVADEQIVAHFSDRAAARRLGQKCDVVTYEFENIPADTVKTLESAGCLVRPGSAVLHVTQNRLREKEFVRSLGIPTAEFCAVASSYELEHAARSVGFPAVLKTADGGYDGKGQFVVRDMSAARRAFAAAAGRTLIWEKMVPFAKELSIIGARGLDGRLVLYPVSENIHANNILDTAIFPGRVSPLAARRAREIGEKIAKRLEIVGVFCVELFLLPDDRVLVNEIAPRPHNSGHSTIDACGVSQFEQQVRAICGLPLGPVELGSPAVMVNILGNGRGDRLEGVDRVLADSRARFHLYGKKEAKTGRKMGHLTVTAESIGEALSTARRLRRALRWTSQKIAVAQRRRRVI